MPPPSPTLALARELGTILGLTEGLDGPTTLHILPKNYAEYIRTSKEIHELSDERYSRCLAEFRALYLPSLVRTLLNNPIEAFEALSPQLFRGYADLVGVHVPTPASYRFAREHPAEATELSKKALSFILDWSDKINTVPDGNWTCVMERLVMLYYDLDLAEAVGQDITRAETDPLRFSSAMRTQLRACLKQLEAIDSTRTQDSPYAQALDDIRAVAFPDKYKTPRGSKLIEKLVDEGRYWVWWACEETRPAHQDIRPFTPCDEGSRDELRTCARCLAVRYCSERHQKADWGRHKLTCVAPTW